MCQVGHSDPKVTLSIYAQVMYRGEGGLERLSVDANPGEQLSLMPSNPA
jgi:hypothetical protein